MPDLHPPARQVFQQHGMALSSVFIRETHQGHEGIIDHPGSDYGPAGECSYSWPAYRDNFRGIHNHIFWDPSTFSDILSRIQQTFNILNSHSCEPFARAPPDQHYGHRGDLPDGKL